MMVVSVVMMVVMTALALGNIYVTALLMTMLIPSLKLKRYVIYSVLFKLFSDLMLYLVAFPLADDMHGCIITRAVH